MIETGSQRKYIQILTGIGFIISIALFVFFKQHPAYFQVGGLFQSYLGSLGLFAPLIFMALQVVQVIYPIVPGGMTSVIGYIAFGPIWGFVYNFTGIFIGSLIAFALARRYGETFVKAFVSQETYDKYIGYLLLYLVSQMIFFAWFLDFQRCHLRNLLRFFCLQSLSHSISILLLVIRVLAIYLPYSNKKLQL